MKLQEAVETLKEWSDNRRWGEKRSKVAFETVLKRALVESQQMARSEPADDDGPQP